MKATVAWLFQPCQPSVVIKARNITNVVRTLIKLAESGEMAYLSCTCMMRLQTISYSTLMGSR
jgi:hypothetical protein